MTKKLLYYNFITIVVIFMNFNLKAQSDYYWVGDGGDWTDYENHWATTSGGSTFHTTAPTSIDDVYFDENSFSIPNQYVYLNSSSAVNVCRNLDCTGVTNSPDLYGYGRRLNVYGSLTLVEDMKLTGSSLYFYSEESVDINTGKNTSFYNGTTSYGNLYFLGSGPYILQDSVRSGNIQVTGSAEVDLNGQYVDLEYLILQSSFIGTFDMSGSEVHTNYFYNYQGPTATTNFQLIHTDSELFISERFYSYGSDHNYGDITLEDEGYIIYFYYYNSTPDIFFEALTIEPGVDLSIASGATLHISDLIALGTPIDLIEIYSSSEGVPVTISKASGTVNAEYLILKDVTAAGGATFNANNSVDHGNNSGWNLTAPTTLDFYWVGNTGYWYDYENHWATTSGGTTFHTREPSRFDDVYFDENSFTSASTLYMSESGKSYTCKNIDWSGITNAVVLYTQYYHRDMHVYGNLTMSALLDFYHFDSKFYLESNEATDISTMNIDWEFQNDAGIIFNGAGPFTIQDSLKGVYRLIFYNDAYVNFNGQYVDATYITFDDLFTGTLDMSSSELHADFWSNQNYESDEDFTLINTDASTYVSRSFISGDSDYNYGDVIFESEGHNMSFTYSEVTDSNFETLTIEAGSTIEVKSGANWNVTELIANGTRANLITLSSDEASSPFTITQSTGTVNATYMDLTDVQATGGAVFNADFSIDGGGNTGWNLTELPPLDYYWVGNTGEWSDVSHWATSSGGSEFHTSPPSRLDYVYFDANSFTETGHSVTLDVDAEAFDMDWSQVSNEPQFISSSSDMIVDIFGSIYLTENMDMSAFNTDFYFYASAPATISMAANATLLTGTYLYFYGSELYTFQSGMHSGSIYINESADIDFNGQYIDIYTLNIESSYTGRLDLSTSEVHVDYLYDNQYNNSGQMELISDQSLLYISRYFRWRSSGVYNYGTVALENEGAETKFENYYTGSPILNLDQLIIEPGVNLSLDNNLTIESNGLNAQGTRNEPIAIYTFVNGQAARFNIPGGNINGTYLILQDIHGTGGATFNANFSTDNGNNDGWLFSAPPEINYYWIGESGDWSDTGHWATTSGGSETHATVPSIYDHVVFDQNSFTSIGQEVLLDTVGFSKDLDWSDASYSPQFTSSNSTNRMNIYGSLYLNEEVDLSSFLSYLNFYTSDSVFIDTDNNTTFSSSSRMSFYGHGAYTLLDSLYSVRVYLYEGADFYANSQYMNIEYLSFLDQYSGIFDISSSEVAVGDLYANYATEFDFIKDYSTLYISKSIYFNSTNMDINLGNVVLKNGNNVSYNNDYNRDVTFDTLTVESGTSFRIRNGRTLYVNTLRTAGTSDDPTEIYSNSSGNQAYISCTTGEINVANMELQDVHAIGGATFNAINSVDNGNNTGWNFITDVTGPSFVSGTPIISTIDGTYITTDVALDEAGVVYYVIQDESISLEPTVEQIFSGLDANGDIAGLAGSFDVFIPNTTYQQTISGLETLTSYQMYLVAEDIASNQQISSVSVDFTTIRSTQLLYLEGIGSKKYGNEPFVLNASSSAELPVTITSSNASILELSGSDATINGAGTVTITVAQEGTTEYAPANKDFEFRIGKARLTLIVDDLEKSYGDANPSIQESFEYSGFVNDEDESFLDEIPTLYLDTDEETSSGSYDLKVDGTDNNYLFATDAVIIINKATQSITFGEIADRNLIDGAFELEATSDSGLPVTYTVLSGTATLQNRVGPLITPLVAGNITVEAVQEGDRNYEEATPVTQSFEVIEEEVLNVQLETVNTQVYPNPMSDVLNIELKDNQSAIIKLYSLEGKLMLEQTIDGQSNTIRANHLSSGVYFLSISNDLNKTEEKKMIIKQ